MRRRPAYPWFGPKRFGWGWRPISREGWIVAFVYFALIGGVVGLAERHVLRGGLIAAVVAALSVALLVVCAVTSGAPGHTRR